MYKDLLFWKKLRDEFVKWVDILADAVVSTLWPKWRNVIFTESSYPTITKDWVTVASQIMLKNKYQNMWVMLAREASENTNREAWDWTTSTISILRSIVKRWAKEIESWINPVLMKRWMDYASSKICDFIKQTKKDIKTDSDRENISIISANNDKELWKIISDTIKSVWKDWVITVSWWMWKWIDVEYIEWIKIDSWYESHLVINDRKRLTSRLENPVIIITTDKLDMQSQLLDVIQNSLKAQKRNILLIASAIEWTALAFLIWNHLQDKFSVIPVKMSSFWDYQRDLLYDLAKKTWATVVWDDCPVKLKMANIEHFWTCDTVVASKDDTILVWANWDVKDRQDEVKALLESEKDTFKIEKLKQRLGRLTWKIANIKILTNSETEQTEIKYRVEDAINAVKSAIDEWVVLWAWTSLLKISDMMNDNVKKMSKDERIWYEIVRESIKSPFRQIIINAWLNPSGIEKEIEKSNNKKCFNVLTSEYCDWFASWIIDPAKCVKNEVLNAVSAASILLTSEVWITDSE